MRFKGVTINDASGTVYNLETTSMPSNLEVIGGFIINHATGATGSESSNGTAIFNYSTGKTIRNKTVEGDESGNLGLCYYPDSGFSSGTSAREEQTIVVKYCYTDTNGKAYYYYIGYYCASGSTGRESAASEDCLTEGTLITMADGTQKPVEDLNVGDMVLAFNHVSGQFEAVPIIFNNHADQPCDTLHHRYKNV